MADHDINTDTLPGLEYQSMAYQYPSITDLKTAILDWDTSGTYTGADLLSMTKNDLLYICRLNEIPILSPASEVAEPGGGN